MRRTASFSSALRMAAFLVASGILASLLLVGARPASAQEARRFRVGYLEGGPYWTFNETMKAIKDALDKVGWLQQVEFVKDASFSPGWGDDKSALIESARKLMDRNDLDVVISAGTDATQALLANNNGKTPIIGIEISDPVGSGFVKSQETSGVDNFTTKVEPELYKTMFYLFHSVVNFKKLGLLYSDTVNGRIYSNVAEARKVARERGFKLVEYNRLSSAEGSEECRKGLRWLIDQGIDAFFIPSLACFDITESSCAEMLKMLNDRKVPTFARDGSEYVRAGAFLGFSTSDFSQKGRFFADQLISILQGEKPGSLKMTSKSYPKIALNFRVAQDLGFQLSSDILTACDEIFLKVARPSFLGQ